MTTDKQKVRLDPDGVPIDPNEWTIDDWRALWLGIRAIKATIAKNHSADRPADRPPAD